MSPSLQPASALHYDGARTDRAHPWPGKARRRRNPAQTLTPSTLGLLALAVAGVISYAAIFTAALRFHFNVWPRTGPVVPGTT